MPVPGVIKWTQSVISSATDTVIVDISAEDGAVATSRIEILELYVSCFVAASSSTIRFEANAGGTVIAALGCAPGTIIGAGLIDRNFAREAQGAIGYALGANEDLAAETVNAATFYVACRYRFIR
jgi:hypothetical protein